VKRWIVILWWMFWPRVYRVRHYLDSTGEVRAKAEK
jgi:hypothetical protein